MTTPTPRARGGIFDVAVVGLGAMGSAALCDLARRGQRAVGLDRSTPGNEFGSSHGESRVFRMAYFEDPAYVPLLRLAQRNWRALEALTGQEVLRATGVLEAGQPGSPIVAASLQSSIEHDLAHERLAAAQVAARFPAFTLPADWEAIFQPDGGVLLADRAIALQIAVAKQAGAVVRDHAQVAAIEPGPRSVKLRLVDGGMIEAGAVVLAAGPWIGELAPFLAPHLRLTRQVLVWFEPTQAALVGPDRMPVFLFDTGGDLIYGFPDIAGTGVKAASHRHGRRLASADAARQDADERDAKPVLEALRAWLPAAAGPVRAMKTCIYTNTPDEAFVLGPHPDFPNLILASPCSGHGFKFASIIGEILADLAITGASDKPIDLFSPTRSFRSS